jgi:hypothetical protein
MAALPAISSATERLCKHYCGANRYTYVCTLDTHWASQGSDRALCDLGNATFAWIYDDLLGGSKWTKFSYSGDADVGAYMAKALASRMFYERFKNWRFGRRIRVPDFIKIIDPIAHRVFWRMVQQESVPIIAQRLGHAEHAIESIAHRINAVLTERHRTHLLQRLTTITLPGEDDTDSPRPEFADSSSAPDAALESARARRAFDKLSWQEQWLIDSMDVEGLSAAALRKALVEEGLTLDDTPPEQLDDNRIYYLRNKARKHLRELFERER